MKMRNLMLGGAMALTLAGCSSGPETPEEVAKSFFEALAHNDLEKAKDLSTGMISVGLEQARKSGDLPSEQKAPKDFSVKVVKSYTVGDTATVILGSGRAGDTAKIFLVKQDDGWRVQDLK